jgi:hypothetical protein
MALSRRIVAESLGTAFLLAAVVGSGIMGEKLAGGNIAIALLANTLATGATSSSFSQKSDGQKRMNRCGSTSHRKQKPEARILEAGRYK